MATLTATTTFPAQLTQARTVLDWAVKAAKPLPAELVEQLWAFDARRMTRCTFEVEMITRAIPHLRATFDALDARACWKCSGTGVYSGATNARRRGVPYCFTCNGAGHTR
jgi:hypothetical protein